MRGQEWVQIDEVLAIKALVYCSRRSTVFLAYWPFLSNKPWHDFRLQQICEKSPVTDFLDVARLKLNRDRKPVLEFEQLRRVDRSAGVVFS